MSAYHKQFGGEYSSIFQDPSVVEAYQHRPAYPPRVFEILAGLMARAARPRIVMDAGCGTGFVARRLAPYTDQVDAVDISAAMIETGRSLPGGDDSRLRWIHGPIESVPLQPPYALIVAAASLHWMDWGIVLPRFAACLAPAGCLAMVEDTALPEPWHVAVGPIISRYSMNKDYQPYSMLTVAEELETRGLFRRQGVEETEAVSFRQTVAEWVEALHARNGFSRDRMDPRAAAECDRLLAETLLRYCPDGVVEQQIGGRVLWGSPMSRTSG